MAIYHYAAPRPISTFDGWRLRSITMNQDRDTFVVDLAQVLGTGATARDVGAATISIAASEALPFLVANFGSLAGATFFDKVLSALAQVGRIPGGGSLV